MKKVVMTTLDTLIDSSAFRPFRRRNALELASIHRTGRAPRPKTGVNAQPLKSPIKTREHRQHFGDTLPDLDSALDRTPQISRFPRVPTKITLFR